MNIAIIVGSTREGRGTLPVAKWVEKTANETYPDHTWTVLDLADYDLPFLTDNPSPQMNQNRQPEGDVKRWLDDLSAADGYVIVTPEYNHSAPAVLKNALDQIDYQLVKKPVAIVSHGFMGGARATAELRLVLGSNLAPVLTPTHVGLIGYVAGGGVINDDYTIAEGRDSDQGALNSCLETLVWFADALKVAREK